MKKRANPAARVGILMLAGILVAAAALFSKDRLSASLMSGQVVTVHFAQAYKLRPFVSQVKVGYVPVGKVVGVERESDGSARVRLKVQRDVLSHLGSAPSATIRPTTLLGGIYFVDLASGGRRGPFAGGTIPVSRTAVPVELDRVAQALQPDALHGLQTSLANVDDFLGAGGGRGALRELMQNADQTLAPASRVLQAAQGTAPQTDLGGIVDGVENTARALTQRPGQLGRIMSNLDTTSATLAAESPRLAQTFDTLPGALTSTRTGLAALDTSLVQLRDVAGRTRAVARGLDSTLERLQPVLSAARPVVSDLRQVVSDARPMTAQLVPTAVTARTTVDDVRGPVISRVNDKVLPFLSAKYHGVAPYADTTSSVPMYEEIALALANVDRVSGMVDQDGNGVSFQPGPGAGSVGGVPINLEQMTRVLRNWINLPQPIQTLPPLSGPGSSQNYQSLLSKLLGGSR